MANFRKHVDPTKAPGGDGSLADPYSSWSELISEEEQPLDTNGNSFDAVLVGTATLNESLYPGVGSWGTPNETDYLHFQGDSGQKRNWNALNTFRYIATNNTGGYVKFSNFRIVCTPSATKGFTNPIGATNVIDGINIESTLGTGEGFMNSGIMHILNTSAAGFAVGCVHNFVSSPKPTTHIRGSVFVDNNEGVNYGSNTGSTMINCYLGNNASGNLTGFPHGISGGVVTDNAEGDIINVPYTAQPTTGTQFLNITPGSYDFDIARPGSQLHLAGINAFNDANLPLQTDANGNPRPNGPQSCCPYEEVSAPTVRRIFSV